MTNQSECKKYKYKYMIPEHGERDLDFDAEEFESKWNVNEKGWEDWHLKWLGEDAANHYFGECDGWDASWPITFEIYSMENELLGRLCIYIDYEPVFTASKLKEGERCYEEI